MSCISKRSEKVTGLKSIFPAGFQAFEKPGTEKESPKKAEDRI